MNPRLLQHHGNTCSTCAAWKKQRRPSACCRRDGVPLRGAPRRRFQACWKCCKTKARCSQQRKELLTCGLLHRPCRELARSVRSVRKRAVCRLRQTLRLREGRGGQTDRQLFSGPVPHPPRRFYVAPPPYTRTRGCAPGGSPIGWAVLLLTSTSRARTRRAPRTARALAVQDGLGAWREGGWVGRRCVWSVGCVFRGSSPASFAFSWCAGRGNYRAHPRVARRFS